MVLEKQDSGISLATTTSDGGGDIARLDGTWSECGDPPNMDGDLLKDGEEDDGEPVAAHKKVCCALCR